MTGYPRHWNTRGAMAILLLPLGAVYFVVSWLRKTLYGLGLLPQIRLPVPVIVVGNLLAGGTGKTPIVIALIAALRNAGFQPGVISRGYGGTATRAMGVSAATDPAIAGDEPVLLAKRTAAPVWVGHARAQVGAALLATDPQCDVLISDDGLQHYPLARTVEIAVFDERGAGNGWPLPAGPLREPMTRLSSVDFVLYQGASAPPAAHPRAFPFRLEGDIFYRLDDASHTLPAAAFAGKRVAAIAGIGNPQRFFKRLRELGITAECHAFPDHHAYTVNDLEFAGVEAILMTEKDAVKCELLARSTHTAVCWALRVDVELPAAMLAAVMEKLNGP